MTQNKIFTATRALIKLNDAILLVKQQRSKTWALPGGGAYPGEPIEWTVMREICQEAGIGGSLDEFVNITLYEGESGRPVIQFTYTFIPSSNEDTIAESIDGLANDVEEIKWFQLKEIEKLLNTSLIRSPLANYDPILFYIENGGIDRHFVEHIPLLRYSGEKLQPFPRQIGRDFQARIVVAAVIQDQKGKYLFAEDTETGRYGLIGSNIDPGMNFHQNLEKIVYDRIGISIAPTSFLGVFHGISDQGNPYLLLAYSVAWLKGNLNIKHAQYKSIEFLNLYELEQLHVEDNLRGGYAVLAPILRLDSLCSKHLSLPGVERCVYAID